MKTNLILAILLICLPIGLKAQTNQSKIPYNLQKTFIAELTSVGGNLTIPNENEVPKCTAGDLNKQVIYSGKSLTTACINVDNRTSTGCVTIVVKANGSTITQTIPAGSVSGVLSFSRVTSVVLIIDHKLTNSLPETVTASGTADFWF